MAHIFALNEMHFYEKNMSNFSLNHCTSFEWLVILRKGKNNVNKNLKQNFFLYIPLAFDWKFIFKKLLFSIIKCLAIIHKYSGS